MQNYVISAIFQKRSLPCTRTKHNRDLSKPGQGPGHGGKRRRYRRLTRNAYWTTRTSRVQFALALKSRSRKPDANLTETSTCHYDSKRAHTTRKRLLKFRRPITQASRQGITMRNCTFPAALKKWSLHCTSTRARRKLPPVKSAEAQIFKMTCPTRHS